MNTYEYELQYETPNGLRRTWDTYWTERAAEKIGAQLLQDNLATYVIIRRVPKRKRVRVRGKWVVAE